MLAFSPVPANSQEPVTVFAAASLKTVLDEISDTYVGSGAGLQLSYAGSSALSRQIQLGAPAQLFISANAEWMDVLQHEALINAASRVDLLKNRLVLIANKELETDLIIEPGFDLSGALGDERLAMAMVDSVPAGLYGRAALTSLGVWNTVSSKVAQTDNARAALRLVAIGEAPFGIVYATDALAEPRVKTIGTFPADSHPPIVYPAAVINGPGMNNAQRFLDYLNTPEARAAFRRHGFELAGGGT